jgi:hypothetical protein
MNVKARIVADVDPSVKEMLQELSDKSGKNKTAVLGLLIKDGYEKYLGKEKRK